MKRLNFKISFSLLALLLVTAVVPFLQSCEEEVERSSGTPMIKYVRLTDPDKSDSLLVSAFLGNTVALMGENLTNVKEVWFNDQQARLNTSYVTNQTIIVTIPSDIPEIVSNMITLVTYKSDEVTYDFKVKVPAPAPNSMLCEFVEDGEEAVIQGNYFIDDTNVPLQVFFAGNIEAEIADISDDYTELTVVVPEGAGVGPVTVKSIYGTTRSSFYFRDDRNIFLNWDDFSFDGWGKHTVASEDGLDGNYVHFTGTFSYGWHETMTFLLSNKDAGLGSDPYYTGDLSSAALKFEINSGTDWTYGAMQFVFAKYDEGTSNGYFQDGQHPSPCWEPWSSSGTFKTDGWQTVTIPLSQFKYTDTGGECDVTLTNDMLCGFYCFILNGRSVLSDVSCEIDIKMDNFRIVPL